MQSVLTSSLRIRPRFCFITDLRPTPPQVHVLPPFWLQILSRPNNMYKIHLPATPANYVMRSSLYPAPMDAISPLRFPTCSLHESRSAPAPPSPLPPPHSPAAPLHFMRTPARYDDALLPTHALYTYPRLRALSRPLGSSTPYAIWPRVSATTACTCYGGRWTLGS